MVGEVGGSVALGMVTYAMCRLLVEYGLGRELLFGRTGSALVILAVLWMLCASLSIGKTKKSA